MGRDPITGLIYIIDVIRQRLSPAQRENKVKTTALLDGEETRIRIPQDPGGAGKFEAYHFWSLSGLTAAAIAALAATR
jgi:phage terminase large subunit-like protein